MSFLVRRLLPIALVAPLLLPGSPLEAGSVALQWDPVPNAWGYRVYYGSQAGSYSQNVDAGNTTSMEVDGLADCTGWFLAVKAYNGAGESPQFSNEVSGWARPKVTSTSPGSRMQGTQFTLDLTGSNFKPGASVKIDNPHVYLDEPRVLSCNQIQVSATIDPLAPGVRAAHIGSYAITVENTDLIFGRKTGAFDVSINPARFDVNRNDDVTRGRLDGKDTVWVSRSFGSREQDAYYNPDVDLNGDGWVDGEDLAFVASNLGRCWTGTAWTTGACDGR